MENGNEKITFEDAMGMIAMNLGNISFPASILASLSPDQIMAIKQHVIDPIEIARRNLCEIMNAYCSAMQYAAEQANHSEEPEPTDEKEVEENGTEIDTE